MAKFFDNMTGKQKLILLFGSVVLLVGARALLPEETQWLLDSVKDLLGVVAQFFRDLGG